MLLTKAILLMINQSFVALALIALIKKTSQIAKSSKTSTDAIKKTTDASLKSVELSKPILMEMKEMKSLLTAPHSAAYIKTEAGEQVIYLFFILENQGHGVAKNVKYSFSPRLWSHDTESAERIIELGKGIDSLPPNYRMKNLFGRAAYYIDLEYGIGEELNTDAPRQFEVTVAFQDAVSSAQYSNKYFLDLGFPLGRCAQ